MAVIVACEYSQVVTKALRGKGIEAFSCDILPTEGNPDWHIQGDAIEVAHSRKWSGMIAHPPCTVFTIAGASKYNSPGRAQERQKAIQFWKTLWAAPIKFKAFENPIPFLSVQNEIGKYSQYVNPFDFGIPERKRICLWLDNLPLLIPTNVVEAPIKKSYLRKTGAKAGKLYHTYYHQGKSAHERARFFPCVAEAMADQWGMYFREGQNQ